jgi:hypothetical protein
MASCGAHKVSKLSNFNAQENGRISILTKGRIFITPPLKKISCTPGFGRQKNNGTQKRKFGIPKKSLPPHSYPMKCHSQILNVVKKLAGDPPSF